MKYSWLDEDGDYVYDSGESRGAQPILAYSSWDKIVIVPDGNVFDNSDADGDGIVAFNEYDNDVLGLNIAEWLAGGGSQEVRFKGTVTNIFTFISATAYAIQIDEVISDPTGNMNEEDTAKVSLSFDSSADVDSVEIGDKVEVHGTYTGYEGGEHAIALEGSGSSLVLAGVNSKKVLFDTAHNEWWTIDNYNEKFGVCILTGRYATFAATLKNVGYEITEFNYKNLYGKYPSGVLLYKHISEKIFTGESPKTLNYNVNVPEGTQSIGISINSVKESGSCAKVTLYDPIGKEKLFKFVPGGIVCDHRSAHIHNPVAGEWKLEVHLHTPSSGELSTLYDFKIDIGAVPTLKEELETRVSHVNR